MNMIIRKKHIVLAALTLALSIAVYLNFVMSGGGKELKLTEKTAEQSSGENYGDTQLVDTEPTDVLDGYFEEARLSRTRSHDEMIDTLKEVFSTVTDDEEEIAEMTDKAVSLARSIDAESKIENLIKAKGLGDCIVYIGDGKADVVLRTEGLLSSEAAVIKSFIVSETDVSAENIKIFEVK